MRCTTVRFHCFFHRWSNIRELPLLSFQIALKYTKVNKRDRYIQIHITCEGIFSVEIMCSAFIDRNRIGFFSLFGAYALFDSLFLYSHRKLCWRNKDFVYALVFYAILATSPPFTLIHFISNRSPVPLDSPFNFTLTRLSFQNKGKCNLATRSHIDPRRKLHFNGAITARCVAYTTTWKISNVDGRKKDAHRENIHCNWKWKQKKK